MLVGVPHEAGGVPCNSLRRGLKLGEELFRGLPLDAQCLPTKKEGDLGLSIHGGHATLMEHAVDLVLLVVGVGVDGVAAPLLGRVARGGGTQLLLRGMSTSMSPPPLTFWRQNSLRTPSSPRRHFPFFLHHFGHSVVVLGVTSFVVVIAVGINAVVVGGGGGGSVLVVVDQVVVA